MIMFFIHDQQCQVRQWRENRQARTQYDPGSAGLGMQPVLHPFSVIQAAVQADQLNIRQAAAKIILQLGRKVDFRHQQ